MRKVVSDAEPLIDICLTIEVTATMNPTPEHRCTFLGDLPYKGLLEIALLTKDQPIVPSWFDRRVSISFLLVAVLFAPLCLSRAGLLTIEIPDKNLRGQLVIAGAKKFAH
jgi:hypothetical protein